MNLFSTVIVVPMLIITSLCTPMMSNMITVWFIMEINNFMFISYIITKVKQKKMIFLYFIIQVMASFLLLFIIVVNPVNLMVATQIIATSALFMKLGVPPFHLWMPIVSKFMPWMSIFLMLTIQKLPPMIILYLINIKEMFFTLLIIMTLIIPPLAMFNLKSIKMLITYSSINQTSWIALLIYLKHQFWLTYYFFYSSVLLTISSIMFYTEISTKFFQHSLKKLNLMFTVMMMNLASMPPFSFFMFKWFSTFMLILNSNIKLLMIMLLFNSLIMTFIYIKMMMWSLFLNKFEMKLIMSSSLISKFKENLWTLLILTSPLIMIL
nr:TPA_asm: NADH dehydrogenase subunit 2 [Pseudomyrmex pallidus]